MEENTSCTGRDKELESGESGISLSPETQIHILSRSIYALRYGMHVLCAKTEKSNKTVNVMLLTR